MSLDRILEPKKAMVAMSGGVDSSVAAFLIKEAGYETIGVTMKLFDNEGDTPVGDKMCCTLEDAEDARRVSNTLGINHYVFNFQEDFDKEVIQRFVRAYEMGMTPNPCIDCNRYIKFKRLFQRGMELKQDYVVTGHYVRILEDKGTGRTLLAKAVDSSKDQSYVLYSMTQEQLSHALFPLGEMKKEETRRIAEKQGFVNAKKRDSQDICFVQNGKYSEFIEEYTGRKYPHGDFVDTKGNVLGEHKGIIKYTIGQRKGLGLALPESLYVKSKDMEGNKVILARDEELFTDRLEVTGLNWIAIPQLKTDLKVSAKIRYSHTEANARLIPISEDRVLVEFDEPQRAITTGQAAVFYDDDIVVGGGTIV